jgi:hypothetical protein
MSGYVCRVDVRGCEFPGALPEVRDHGFWRGERQSQKIERKVLNWATKPQSMVWFSPEAQHDALIVPVNVADLFFAYHG